MSIENAILGLLSWHPLTGYDIKKMFEGSPALYWSGNNNQIYKALIKLHEEGLVSREVELQEDSPSRKIYAITPAGKTVLKEWVLSQPELPQIKNAFLIQLAWSDALTAGELDGILETYETDMRMQVAMLQHQEKQKNLSPSGVPRDAYINPALARTPREALLWQAIQENWLTYYQRELDWVCRLRQALTKSQDS
ncbi:MAG: PadR family transcriptional regulator [Chloroflexota bacterium]